MDEAARHGNCLSRYWSTGNHAGQNAISLIGRTNSAATLETKPSMLSMEVVVNVMSTIRPRKLATRKRRVNDWFGTCGSPDITRLNEVRPCQIVVKRPVWMNLSDQHGLPVDPPIPDAYGMAFPSIDAFGAIRLGHISAIRPTDSYLVPPWSCGTHQAYDWARDSFYS